LVLEAMVERPLGDPRAVDDLLDARGAVSVREKKRRRDVENPLPELFGVRPRRAASERGAGRSPHFTTRSTAAVVVLARIGLARIIRPRRVLIVGRRIVGA